MAVILLIILQKKCADAESRGSAMLFGRTLASVTQKQQAGRSAVEDTSASQTDVAVATTECSSPAGREKLSTATPSGMFRFCTFIAYCILRLLKSRELHVAKNRQSILIAIFLICLARSCQI